MKVAITVELDAGDTRTEEEILALYIEDQVEFFNGAEWEIRRAELTFGEARRIAMQVGAETGAGIKADREGEAARIRGEKDAEAKRG